MIGKGVRDENEREEGAREPEGEGRMERTMTKWMTQFQQSNILYKVQEDYRIHVHVHDQSRTCIWKLKQGKASEAKFEGRQ